MTDQDPQGKRAADQAQNDAQDVGSRRPAAVSLMVVTLAVVTVAMLAMNRVQDALRPACVNTIVESVPSPDDAWTAVLFERNCGATTSFTSQVSVLRSGRALPDGAGNAFVAVRGDTAGTTPWGGPLVSIRWAGSRELEISRDPTAHTMSSSRRVGDVHVHLIEIPGGSSTND